MASSVPDRREIHRLTTALCYIGFAFHLSILRRPETPQFGFRHMEHSVERLWFGGTQCRWISTLPAHFADDHRRRILVDATEVNVCYLKTRVAKLLFGASTRREPSAPFARRSHAGRVRPRSESEPERAVRSRASLIIISGRTPGHPSAARAYPGCRAASRESGIRAVRCALSS